MIVNPNKPWINKKEIKRQADAIAERFEKFGKRLNNKEVLEGLALQAKNAILLRTAQGKDIEGSPFPKLSKGYAAKEGKRTSNLIRTGQMLNSITQAVIGNNQAVKIFFATGDRISGKMTNNDLAKIHNDLGAGKSRVVRRFFGINLQDEVKIVENYKKFVKKEQEAVGL